MNKFIYILSTVVFAGLLFGCDAESASQDPEEVGSTVNYPTPSFVFSGGELTTNERNQTVIVYDVTLDKPTNRPIDFNWVVLESSTATDHDDYELSGGSVPAYQLTTQLTVTILNDVVVEGTETLDLTIESGPSLANKYLVNPNTDYPKLSVQIEDFLFCLWTLDSTDVYGDGWNGGSIEVVSEGVTTNYATEGPNEFFEIPIALGADYSFTYVSGGGTGGSPGWESENYYVLTAPDGTEYVDGSLDYSGIPTPGLIASGVADCQ